MGLSALGSAVPGDTTFVAPASRAQFPTSGFQLPIAWFESAEWDTWRKELTSTLDVEKRKAAARKLQEIALDECFTIPVAPALPVFAYASYVKGFGVTMDNSIYIGDMWLDK
jgi:ABC-type transport system substrate-binding protein